MSKTDHLLTRRDFVKIAGGAAAGIAAGLPVWAEEPAPPVTKSRVVLVRHEHVVDAEGQVAADILGDMLDEAVTALLDEKNPATCWQKLISPDDIVGIKTNEWGNLRTPVALEQVIKKGVRQAGIPEKNIGIADRRVLHDPLFTKTTALINVRPMRTHAWSGVGSLIKNYIMFSPDPPHYHPNTCADLGALWELPLVKGKTRLNCLVMLTPLFHGRGWHHFDPQYVWTYGGILVGTDPVAVDTVGLQILEARRTQYFGEERPIRPPAHHIRFADTKFHLGTSDPGKIDLVRLGWAEGALI